MINTDSLGCSGGYKQGKPLYIMGLGVFGTGVFQMFRRCSGVGLRGKSFVINGLQRYFWDVLDA